MKSIDISSKTDDACPECGGDRRTCGSDCPKEEETTVARLTFSVCAGDVEGRTVRIRVYPPHASNSAGECDTYTEYLFCRPVLGPPRPASARERYHGSSMTAVGLVDLFKAQTVAADWFRARHGGDGAHTLDSFATTAQEPSEDPRPETWTMVTAV